MVLLKKEKFRLVHLPNACVLSPGSGKMRNFKITF